MREKITFKQRLTLECLDNFIKEHGYSPTYQELADELHCDVNTVFKKICILVDRGYVSQTSGKIRTMKVIKRYD